MTALRQFDAGAIGPLAWQRLAGLPGARFGGRVVAAFGSAFYVELGSGLVCIATRAVEPGPLTVLTSGSGGLDWRRIGITPRQPVQASASGLEIPGLIRIDLTNCDRWTPPAPPVSPTEASITAGLAALSAVMPADLSTLGFGAFIKPVRHRAGLPREVEAAAAPVAAACQWASVAVSAGAADLPLWSTRLVGLGPGLTPSGDDFLGGMLIALRTLGAEAARRQLSWVVCPLLEARTNQISAALLDAAVEGYGGASLHMALNALLGGGSGLAPAIAGVARIGHSSGWDALSGMVTVLAAAQANPKQCAA